MRVHCQHDDDVPHIGQLAMSALGVPTHPGRKGALFVAVHGAQTVGHIYVGEIIDDPVGRFASFELNVESAVRRRGWGGRLVNEAENWARQSSLACMIISVQPDNAAALALYVRLGYQLTWHERNRVEGSQQELMHVFAKDLTTTQFARSAIPHLFDAA